MNDAMNCYVQSELNLENNEQNKVDRTKKELIPQVR